MQYSVDINRSIESLAYCLNELKDYIDFWGWNVVINAGGIDYGIYFNFDIDNKELEISNCPEYDDSLGLSEIIDEINRMYGEED